ncbi:MAG: ATP-binding protein [Candidatus Alcyoniella australis]|nr:ATP-binding protein [Candidatus Alcyoniella australis]
MKQLVVLSGKGGTGKTSIVGAFAALADNVALADCDVDAADLHLILDPQVALEHEFLGGLSASNDLEQCSECGRCLELCRFEAISPQFVIDQLACEGCGACADHCPVTSISLTHEIAGRWFESETRFGPLIHARLGIAQENSGKLVSQVKARAVEVCAQRGIETLLVDGPPGIGCPVIASLSGANMLLIISEPSPSGLHDLERVLQLAAHFKLPSAICVNRYDIDERMCEQIEERAVQLGATVVGRVPFDSAITRAQLAARTLPELGESATLEVLRAVYNETMRLLHKE